MRIVAALLVACLAAFLGGCGGDDESETERRQNEAKIQQSVQSERLKSLLEVKQEEFQRRRENPDEVLAPSRFEGAQADRYESDREICKALSPEELADNFDIDSDDPEEIAEAYSKSMPRQYRQAALEGCLAGFESS
jgi:hypothetical protein